MTPEELKNLALKATEPEYLQIKAHMEAAAKHGSFSATFPQLSQGAVEQLRNEGFVVTKKVIARMAIGKDIEGWKVSFE